MSVALPFAELKALVAAVVPPSRIPPAFWCEHRDCRGPASHVVGRHSGRTFVVPSVCFHRPYVLKDGPGEYAPNEQTAVFINRLITDANFHRQHFPAAATADRPGRVRRDRGGTRAQSRAAYRPARSAGRSSPELAGGVGV